MSDCKWLFISVTNHIEAKGTLWSKYLMHLIIFIIVLSFIEQQIQLLSRCIFTYATDSILCTREQTAKGTCSWADKKGSDKKMTSLLTRTVIMTRDYCNETDSIILEMWKWWLDVNEISPLRRSASKDRHLSFSGYEKINEKKLFLSIRDS